MVAEEALKVAVAQESSVSAVAEDSREVVILSEGHDIAFDKRVCSSLRASETRLKVDVISRAGSSRSAGSVECQYPSK